MATGTYCVLPCPHCDKTIEALFADRAISCPHCCGTVNKPEFPILDAAGQHIRVLPVMPYSAYSRLPPERRRSVFAVPRIEDTRILKTIKEILVDCFERGQDQRDFERALRMAFGRTLALPASDIERVYRANINSALLRGLMATIEQPLVASGFPYLQFDATHDDRTPQTHLALECFGLNGTAVYRRDDPFWRRFTPPLTDLCRCSVTALTLRMAADKGVREAVEWLRTDQPPKRPHWIGSPAFDPRLELEDEWWPDPMAMETAEGILKEILAARSRVVDELRRRNSEDGRLCGVPMPRTQDEGLALLQGRTRADFILPPLQFYISSMERADMEQIPAWTGEPDNELEFLRTVNAIIACCRLNIGK